MNAFYIRNLNEVRFRRTLKIPKNKKTLSFKYLKILIFKPLLLYFYIYFRIKGLPCETVKLKKRNTLKNEKKIIGD